MADISRSETISTRQQAIAKLAQQAPQMSFTSLNHHIDMVWLHEAYRRTQKDGAPGIDGQTADAYAEHLEENLQDVLDRAKSGRYRAPAVKRAYIPKGDGSTTRPIGVPTFEDKLLQRAVAMVLEPIYEQDFLDCSYGFRPGRSAHQALQVWRDQLMRIGGGWIIELDVERFFDTLDKAQLRAFVHRRVRDGVVLRLIGKWLHAGVLEEGDVTYPDAGTPQDARTLSDDPESLAQALESNSVFGRVTPPQKRDMVRALRGHGVPVLEGHAVTEAIAATGKHGIIGANDAMDAQSLPKVSMPNRDGFIPFPRYPR